MNIENKNLLPVITSENDIYPYGDNEFTGFVNPHLQDKKSEEVHS